MIGVVIEWLFSQPEIHHCAKIDEGHRLKSLPPTAFVFVLTFIRFSLTIWASAYWSISQIIYVLKQFEPGYKKEKPDHFLYEFCHPFHQGCIRFIQDWKSLPHWVDEFRNISSQYGTLAWYALTDWSHYCNSSCYSVKLGLESNEVDDDVNAFRVLETDWSYVGIGILLYHVTSIWTFSNLLIQLH